ncbi:MAG TPA: radical SAM protein, partial [Rectinemataceae bacterium]
MESRLNRHADRLLERHGERVWRLGLDAGFACPHRASGRGRGGCSFCSPEAGLAAYQHEGSRLVVGLEEQIERAVLFSERRYGAKRFFLYFQAYTCTNLPEDELAPIYDRAIGCLESLRPGSLAGIVVSTRPDCFDQGKAELLSGYARSGLEVWVELGLQSSDEASLARMRRGHDSASYARAAEVAGQAGLRRAVHLILGLPGEG